MGEVAPIPPYAFAPAALRSSSRGAHTHAPVKNPCYGLGEHAAASNSRLDLDLSKVFNFVPQDLLLAKLKANGVAEHGVAPLRNYLIGGSQKVKLGDKCFFGWQL